MDAEQAPTSCSESSEVSLVRNGATATSNSDATVFFSAAVSEDDSFRLSSSVPAASVAENSDSSETACFLMPQPSGQAGASDSKSRPRAVMPRKDG